MRISLSWLIQLKTELALFIACTGVYCGLEYKQWPLKRTLLARKVFSGIMYPCSSDKTNAHQISRYPQKSMFTGTKGPTDVPLVVMGYLKGLWGSNMQHTAVNLVKMSWALLNSWSFFSRHIIVLNVFCCHRRSSYLCAIRFLQWCPIIKKSLNKADHCKCRAMAGKISNSKRKPSVKFWLLKLSRYQVLRLVMLKMILRKRDNNSKPRQKSNHKLQ